MNIDTALISRLEVIDDEGRALSVRPTTVTLSVQDNGRTLKVFTKGAAALRSQVQTERTPEVQKAKEQLEAQFELMRLADTDTEWRLETLRRSYRSAIDCLVDAVLRSAPALTQGEQEDGGTSLTAGDGVSVSVPAPELPHDGLTKILVNLT